MGEKLTRNSDSIERYIDRLKDMQDELKSFINSSESELANLDNQITTLNERRVGLVTEIGRKKEALINLEKSIGNAENSFCKLVESSESLIAFIKKETVEVRKAMNDSPTVLDSQKC